MAIEDLLETFRQELVELLETRPQNESAYDHAEATLQTLLSLNLPNDALCFIVSSIIGLYQDSFFYGAKIFSQLSRINLAPLHIYQYLVDNIPSGSICYLATGINVRSEQLFSVMLNEPNCWLLLMHNKYLSATKRKKLLRKVVRYIEDDPLSEYKAVLYRCLYGGIFAKSLECVSLPYDD